MHEYLSESFTQAGTIDITAAGFIFEYNLVKKFCSIVFLCKTENLVLAFAVFVEGDNTINDTLGNNASNLVPNDRPVFFCDSCCLPFSITPPRGIKCFKHSRFHCLIVHLGFRQAHSLVIYVKLLPCYNKCEFTGSDHWPDSLINSRTPGICFQLHFVFTGS